MQNHPHTLAAANSIAAFLLRLSCWGQELKEDLVDRAKDEYEGKTIMICWEHKNMCTPLTLLCSCELL